MNYLSNTGFFNDSTMASVSASYHNLFTPAGYAFSIWLFIYVGLGAFVIYQSKGLFSHEEPYPIVTKIGWMFVVSCAANCAWILAWLYDYTGLSVVVMILLLASLFVIVVRTRMELDLITFKRIALESWPFAIYIGWICVALLANISAYLTKIGWDKVGISELTATLTMIGVAVAANPLLIWKRNLRESASVGAWALIAIGVANWDKNQMVAYCALGGAIILLIASGIHSYLNRNERFIPISKTPADSIVTPRQVP